VTWLIHMCDMTHSYVWHDSFICVTWLIHMCDMTHSYVWHDSWRYVTIRRESTEITRSCRTYKCIILTFHTMQWYTYKFVSLHCRFVSLPLICATFLYHCPLYVRHLYVRQEPVIWGIICVSLLKFVSLGVSLHGAKY